MNHFEINPTPISELKCYSQVLGVNMYCKRDDLFPIAGGGNKARMLQYILFDLTQKNYDRVLTAGGPCSNFNRACALMCAQLGVPMHLVEYTENVGEYETSLNYKLSKLSGIITTRCEKSKVVETLAKVKDSYSSLKVKTIYGGGKSLEGFYAYYDAIKELYKQNKSIEHLFITCGTGTTLTGISAGMQEYYPKAKVHAISIARTKEEEYPVLEDNMTVLNDYLKTSYNLDNIIFYDNFRFGGYGAYDSNIVDLIKDCASKEGLTLDPTYTGKAFYAMIAIIKSNSYLKNKNILFWNTGGIFNLLSELRLW